MLVVPFDVKPCRCPNPLNVLTQVILTAAILGTDDFNVDKIKEDSILLEGVAPMLHEVRDMATPYEAVPEECDDCTSKGPDGIEDLLLRFDAEEVLATLGNVSEEKDCIRLTIYGELYDRKTFVGEDMVQIIYKGNKPGS